MTGVTVTVTGTVAPVATFPILQSGAVVVASVHEPGEIEIELPPVFWGSEKMTCVLPASSNPVFVALKVNWNVGGPSLEVAAVAKDAGTIANFAWFCRIV